MIDVAFYGRKLFGIRWQTAAEKSVISKWREYFDNLNISNEGLTQDQSDRLFAERRNKSIALLHSIAIAQNYDFEPLDLRKNAYSPIAHEKIDNANYAIRSGLVELISGNRPVKMEITNLPQPNPYNPPVNR
jgi:hypothetical protein